MANEITPFSNTSLPAFLQTADAQEVNKGLMSHVSVSFPVLSIEGKKFSVVQNGEKRVLMNPLDPRSVAQIITVVLVNVPQYTARSYYSGTYDPTNEEAKTPICFSSTGIIPDEASAQPQCRTCALCQYSQFGSAVDASGKHTKGKACREGVRLAVAALDEIDNPMLLRVPPTSLKALGDLGLLLKRRNVPYTSVVIEISFDPESTAQKLVFTPIGFVNAEQFAQINEVAKGEKVKAITGLTDDVLARLNQSGVQGSAPVRAQAVASTMSPAAARAVAQQKVTVEAVEEAISGGEVEPEGKKVVSSQEVAAKGLDALGDAFDD